MPIPDAAPKTVRPKRSAAPQRRLATEVALLAAAQADIAAGRTVSSEAVDAWIDSLPTDHPIPPPQPGS